MEKNDSSKTIIIVLLLIAILCLGGYTVYDKVLSPKEDAQEENNKDDEKENENNPIEEPKKDNDEKPDDSSTVNPSVNKSNCLGTYYGETNGTQSNGLSYSCKYTITLKEDGKHTSNWGNGVKGGTYVINGNTLTVIEHDDVLVGDSPSYFSTDFVIADDCSYIKAYCNDFPFNLNRK